MGGHNQPEPVSVLSSSDDDQGGNGNDGWQDIPNSYGNDNDDDERGGGTGDVSRGVVGGSRQGSGVDGSQQMGGFYHNDTQHGGGMTWAQGNENYYATRDTKHGYRSGISEQQRHLDNLARFPSSDEYSSGYDP